MLQVNYVIILYYHVNLYAYSVLLKGKNLLYIAEKLSRCHAGISAVSASIETGLARNES